MDLVKKARKELLMQRLEDSDDDEDEEAESEQFYRKRRIPQPYDVFEDLPFEESPPDPTSPKAQDVDILLPKNEYQYVPIEDTEVRLLYLIPSDPPEDHASQIKCALRTVPFRKLGRRGFEYEAVSYHWGDDDPENPIYLFDMSLERRASALGNVGKSSKQALKQLFEQAQPRKFHIRRNLFTALQRFRENLKENLCLWVDAVCINQKDGEEKTHQLKKMLDIYSKAYTVRVWIGDADQTSRSNEAMKFIKKAVDLKLLDRLVLPDPTNPSSTNETAANWVALANLLKRPWFTRRWVVQEVAAAKAVAIQCGAADCNWVDFADAIELFMAKLPDIRKLFEVSDCSKTDPDALKNVESFGAKDMVRTTNNIFRKNDSGQVIEWLRGIENLVHDLLSFEATDPRDTVYALLGIAKDGPQRVVHCQTEWDVAPLDLDYNKHPLEVYIDFVQYCIQKTESLDIICRHWALPVTQAHIAGSGSTLRKRAVDATEIKLPSWTGLLKDSAFGPPTKFTGRLNADSLVGDPGQRVYNASGNTQLFFEFGKAELYTPPIHVPALQRHMETETYKRRSRSARDAAPRPDMFNMLENTGIHPRNVSPLQPPRPQDRVTDTRPNFFDGALYVKGIVLDKINWLSSRISEGTIPRECLVAAGWKFGHNLNDVAEKLWRTLIADRGPNGKNPPHWYRRACLYCLAKASPNGDINTDRLIQDTSQPQSLREYLMRVQAVVWNRKFFACHVDDSDTASTSAVSHTTPEKQSIFGLCSWHTEPGDVVCILFGCSVPVVLRRIEGPEGAPGAKIRARPYYEFIGECFAYGKMDGEAVAGMSEKELDKKTKMFEIR
jgi:Heterokaryon incompatibility protein (HET)